MKIKRLLFSFVVIFAITFFVSAAVNFLWNLIFHGMSSVVWETSFRFAIILGIILTWIQEKGK
jgi:hypothetical protein